MLVGSAVRISAKVYNATQAPAVLADPTDLTLKLKDGQGAITTYLFSLGQVVRDGIGLYHVDFTTAVTGLHVAHWVASGVIARVDETTFNVDKGAVA